MRIVIVFIAISAFNCLLFNTTCFAEEYPYRNFYTEVAIIEIADLKAGYDKGNFIIIDVRSSAEFELIHIKSAISLPYSTLKFTDNLAEVARQHANKKIVLYCNGCESIKSYKAAEDALYTQIQGVYAFDGGILTWAEAYSAATIFKGELLSKTEGQLIRPDVFQNACLDFDSFEKQAALSNAVVIDSRDPIQRTQKIPGLEEAMQIPIDKLVKNIISKGNMKDQKLYIFDQVGRQAYWLMYYLVENGYTDFYFLNGGATTVLKNQDYR